jgi:modulator of FtsH protease
MALFDRDYIKEQNNKQENVFSNAGQNSFARTNIQSFVRQTYQLFSASMLVGAVGAYVGVGIAPSLGLGIFALIILELGLLFGLNFVKHKPGINLLVMFSFTFVSGMTLGPLLYKFLGMPGGPSIVAGTFLATAIIFGGLSLVAMFSKIDFTQMGKVLFIMVILLIVSSIVNMFIMSSAFQAVIAGVGTVVFSGFILYDTQNIIRGNYESPIDGAVALYLDFLNLFVMLLQLVGILGSSDD